jgi:hypothetical protein
VSGTDPAAELHRPGTVTAAAWLSIACSLLCFLVFSILTVVFLLARGDFVDALSKADGTQVPSDMDPGTAANIAIAVVAVFTVWCAAASASALLALRRSKVGRWLLTASAVLSSLFSLVGTFAFGIPVMFLMAAVVVVVLLFTPSANSWYARRGAYAIDLPVGTTQPWG